MLLVFKPAFIFLKVGFFLNHQLFAKCIIKYSKKSWLKNRKTYFCAIFIFTQYKQSIK